MKEFVPEYVRLFLRLCFFVFVFVFVSKQKNFIFCWVNSNYKYHYLLHVRLHFRFVSNKFYCKSLTRF